MAKLTIESTNTNVAKLLNMLLQHNLLGGDFKISATWGDRS